MNYSEQYKHPKWQKRRLEILERDNFTCQKCGDTDTMLHVHHLKYYKNLEVWNYKDFDLITLCEDCHKIITILNINKNDFKKCLIDKWVIGDNERQMSIISINGTFIATSEFRIDSKETLISLRSMINHAIRNNHG